MKTTTKTVVRWIVWKDDQEVARYPSKKRATVVAEHVDGIVMKYRKEWQS